MPSIQDVADQVNAKLDTIQQNTGQTVAVGNGIRSDLATANATLDRIDSDLNAGVAALASGLLAIWETQKATNSILEFQSRQNEAIMCLLRDANELLCGITRKLTREVDLSEQTLASSRRIEGIAERTEAAAAADYDRHLEMKQDLAACCPPPETPMEPCPEGCESPRGKTYQPKGQDWRPPVVRDGDIR